MADQEIAELVAAGGYANTDAAYAAITAEMPLGRAADPRGIASAISFLGAGDSAYMPGRYWPWTEAPPTQVRYMHCLTR